MSFSEWKEYKLSDLFKIKHGYAFKGKYFSNEETKYILLTPGNFRIGGGFQDKKRKYYSEEGLVPEDYILHENDLLVTMTDLSKLGDTLGYPIKVPTISDKTLLHNQRLGKIEFINSLVEKDFLYYLLCWSKYRNEVLASATGTTVKHTAPDRILKFTCGIPSNEEQKAIANILSSLDEKIELNNQMNKTLEEMAQALFKRWFVDFEFPNEDGKPYKSSGGEMVDSELGMIPKGWEVSNLGDIINIVSGKRPPKKSPILDTEYVVPLIGASSIIGYVPEPLFDENILVIGRVGTHGIVQRYNNKVWPSDNTLVIKTVYYEYVYQVLKLLDYSSINRGSTQPLITQSDIKAINILKPDLDIIKKYEETSSKLFEQVNCNNIEIKILEISRDTLLPKLMSGEIRVTDLQN